MNSFMTNKKPISNLLNLEAPDTWKCSVIKFSRPSLLDIHVHNPKSKQTYKVLFVRLEYYTGLINWTGANFQLKQEVECENLVRRLHLRRNLTSEYIAREFRLITVQTISPSNEEILILAAPTIEIETETGSELLEI